MSQIVSNIKKDVPCVYGIFNKSGEYVYIGQTKQPLTRYVQHINLLSKGKHYNKMLQEDYNLGNDFTFEIILEYKGEEKEGETLRYRELQVMSIAREKKYKLYNKETDSEIESLMKYNSKEWKIYVEKLEEEKIKEKAWKEFISENEMVSFYININDRRKLENMGGSLEEQINMAIKKYIRRR